MHCIVPFQGQCCEWGPAFQLSKEKQTGTNGQVFTDAHGFKIQKVNRLRQGKNTSIPAYIIRSIHRWQADKNYLSVQIRFIRVPKLLIKMSPLRWTNRPPLPVPPLSLLASGFPAYSSGLPYPLSPTQPTNQHANGMPRTVCKVYRHQFEWFFHNYSSYVHNHFKLNNYLSRLNNII